MSYDPMSNEEFDNVFGLISSLNADELPILKNRIEELLTATQEYIDNPPNSEGIDGLLERIPAQEVANTLVKRLRPHMSELLRLVLTGEVSSSVFVTEIDETPILVNISVESISKITLIAR